MTLDEAIQYVIQTKKAAFAVTSEWEVPLGAVLEEVTSYVVDYGLDYEDDPNTYEWELWINGDPQGQDVPEEAKALDYKPVPEEVSSAELMWYEGYIVLGLYKGRSLSELLDEE